MENDSRTENTEFAFVAYAGLECAELRLQTPVETVVVRAATDEHRHKDDDCDHQHRSDATHRHRPPAERPPSTPATSWPRGVAADVLHVAEIKPQPTHAHLYVHIDTVPSTHTISHSQKWQRRKYDNTHTRLTALCPGLPGYQKGKTNLDFTEARDSEWQ